MSARPAVLIIGGGPWQLALIQRAVDMGLRTIVTDRDPHAPARSVAHSFSRIDMQDLGALCAIARRERVALVISDQTDRAVPVIARINEALDLPGIRPIIASRFTDKRIMRRALHGAAVRLPAYDVVPSCEEACAAARTIGYPVVIKPVAAQSSIGVHYIEDETTLRLRFEACLAHSAGVILVEEFVDGLELTVEGIVIDGRHRVLAVSEKAHYSDLPCVARRLAYPPRLNGDALRAVRAAADVAVNELGLRDGLTHAEVRLRSGIPHLIEIAARGGGHGVASTIVPHVSGVDVYGLLLRRLLGQNLRVPDSCSRAGLLEFLQLSSGRVRAVRGVDAARRRRLAHTLHVPYRPGDTVVRPTNDTDRGAYFIALDDTRERVESRAARIRRLIRVTYA